MPAPRGTMSVTSVEQGEPPYSPQLSHMNWGTVVTSLARRCEILSQVWMEHRQDDDFQDFVEFNDLGLPLAYIAAEKLARLTDEGKACVNETFELLLEALDQEDADWADLEDLLGARR
jgi:hypothetical protein